MRFIILTFFSIWSLLISTISQADTKPLEVNHSLLVNRQQPVMRRTDVPPSIITFNRSYKHGENGLFSLQGISDVVVSNSGKFVLTASYASGAVSIFERNVATGFLTYRNMISGIINAFGLVISPDDKHIYAASPSGTIDAILINPTDLSLTLLTKNLKPGATGGFVSVSISPDGKWVYGIGGSPSGLVVFRRDASTGQLTFVADYADNMNEHVLGQSFGPTVSPIKNTATSADGQFLYVSSTLDHAVTVFRVNQTTGALSQLAWYINGISGVSGLNGASSVRLSPNGRYLYVSGQSSNAIAIFRVDATSGLLTFVGQVAQGDPGISKLQGVRSLTISPDGRYLFASAITSHAINVFSVNPNTGLLTLVTEAVDSENNISGLTQPSGMATDLGSRHLYVAGQSAHSLVAFNLPIPSVEIQMDTVQMEYKSPFTSLDTTLLLFDADNDHLQGATLEISEGFSLKDSLQVTLKSGITGDFNAATGVLTLSGSAPLSTYQDVLRSLKYKPSVDITLGTDTIFNKKMSYSVNDGENESAKASLLVQVNVPPTPIQAILLSDTTIAGNAAVGTVVGAFSALSSTSASTFTYTLVSGTGSDGNSNFSIQGNLLRTASLFDFATQSSYNIRVQVTDQADFTFQKTFVLQVLDNSNEAPVVTNSTGNTTFNEVEGLEQVPVAIDPSLTVTDANHSALYQAIIQITDGFADQEDALSFTNNGSTMGNIAGSFNMGNGTLTMTSTDTSATLAQWQAALRSVTYVNHSKDPSTEARTIVFTIDDGETNSAASSKKIEVNAINDRPILTGVPETSVLQDNAYSFTPVAQDLDGDDLIFHIVNKPSWATFDSQTGELSGTPSFSNVGTTEGIVISVADSAGSRDLPAFDLTVTTNIISGVALKDSTFIYDGTLKSLEIQGTQPENTTIEWVNNGRTDIGEQQVTVRITGLGYTPFEAIAQLRISPATITGVTLTDSTFVYDGTAKSLAVQGILPDGVTVSYATNTRTNVGTQVVTATLSGSNYVSSTLTANLTISPATITGVSLTDSTFVYDGSAKSLALQGILPDGVTVSYATNTRTNVGTQVVTATLSGSNYVSSTLTANLTISPATITGVTLTDSTFVYDGTAKSLAVQGILPNGVTVNYTTHSRTNVGTQVVTATLSGNNYVSSTLTANLIISPATITGVSLTDSTFVYDGTAKSLAVQGILPNGVTVSYATNTRTNVGTQVITATLSGSNYVSSTLTANLTISPAKINGVHLEHQMVVYNGTDKFLKIVGDLPPGTTVQYLNNNHTNVGHYVVGAIVSGNNYETLELEAALVITPAAITQLSLIDQSFVYDGTAKSLTLRGFLPQGTTVQWTQNSRTIVGTQEVTATISGANYNQVVLRADLTITPADFTGITLRDSVFIYDGTTKSLSVSGKLPEGASVTYTHQSRLNAGTQRVTATISAPHYTTLVLQATLQINTAVRTLQFDLLSEKTFGDESFTLQALASTSETVGFTSSNPSVALIQGNQVQIVGAGVTQITATVAAHENYGAAISITRTLTIKKAQQTITLEAPTEVQLHEGVITVKATSTSGLPVQLRLADTQNAQLEGTRLRLLKEGMVTLIASQAGDNNIQAAQEVAIPIRILNPVSNIVLQVHRALSPNGDGINDFVKIEGIEGYNSNKVSFMSSAGEMVWTASGYNNGSVAFRGLSNKNARLTAGTYFYLIEINHQGKVHYERGYVILRY
jgi:6-phosphogluconolactonase (cycloisomerase 2 family)